MMLSLALIGLLGGLITGISPCILPVLPVIFFSGTQGPADGAADGAVAVKSKPDVLRPYRVIGGLVLSFSLVTLVGSALLALLHLPQGAVGRVGGDRSGVDLPAFRAAAGAAVFAHSAKADRHPGRRFWSRPGAG